ncbi:DUF4136 domain-containing protein [Rhizorhapis suberifaciens]|uniref:DUF4136 domain-containing protein n=1 Tax=Rhizorhapis suberifaciens TaxID=13656 RepID=A0A840HUW0_9SPHN|nr:DUF4136 domain-containing protein [Rhizorhapis suberifaciens]MBB4641387.1 hypothetical protein [Rhizorhapis suberifaciens]
MNKRIAALLVPMTLAGCQTAVAPVEVTRFHMGDQTGRGSVAVEPMTLSDDSSIEYRTYAAAVAQELQRIGFAEQTGANSQYVASVNYMRGVRDTLGGGRSPVSVGVGGATGSYGSGVGLGVGINLSGPPKPLVTTQLNVQIRRRSDRSVIWEGRAVTEAKEGSPAAQPGMAASKLAEALFKDFPGVSGQTIKVK